MSGVDVVTHLDHPALAHDLDGVAERARAAGIDGWVVAAGDPDRWEQVRRAAERTGGWVALGWHPWWVTDETDPERVVEALDAADPPVVGEIGLDHKVGPKPVPRSVQRAVFEAQLAWARERDRPVILHVVGATPEALQSVDRVGLPAPGGVLHGLSDGPDGACAAVARGLCLGIGLRIGAPNGHKIRDSVAAVERRWIVLETDAPEQRLPGVDTPEPAHARRVAEGVARVWGASTEAVLAETGAHARRVLGAPSRA